MGSCGNSLIETLSIQNKVIDGHNAYFSSVLGKFELLALAYASDCMIMFHENCTKYPASHIPWRFLSTIYWSQRIRFDKFDVIYSSRKCVSRSIPHNAKELLHHIISKIHHTRNLWRNSQSNFEVNWWNILCYICEKTRELKDRSGDRTCTVPTAKNR